MVGIMTVVVTSFKRTSASTLGLPGLFVSVSLTLRQATVDPRLRQRLLDIHRQVWLSLLWGHRSVILGPGVSTVLSVPSNSLFPQSREVLQLNPPGLQSQIPWVFSVPLPIPRLGNLLSALELLQQCENFFHTIVP